MPRQTVHKGRKIEVQLDVSLGPDGREVRRDVVLHPGAVVILPLLADGRVCLLRNFRFVLGQTLWEVPAGTLEPGEPPEQAAVRELAEETGYAAARWRNLGVFYPSPGVLSEAMHLFVAQDLTPGPARPEADEQLEPVLVAWDEALRMVTAGAIHDLKTVAALLLWDRLRGTLPPG
jgi:ADP-ribose pyrophosphatase